MRRALGSRRSVDELGETGIDQAERFFLPLAVGLYAAAAVLSVFAGGVGRAANGCAVSALAGRPKHFMLEPDHLGKRARLRIHLLACGQASIKPHPHVGFHLRRILAAGAVTVIDRQAF